MKVSLALIIRLCSRCIGSKYRNIQKASLIAR